MLFACKRNDKKTLLFICQKGVAAPRKKQCTLHQIFHGIMKLFIPIFCFFVLLLSSCQGDTDAKPTIPPLTTTGQNTLGCYLNDTLMIGKKNNVPNETMGSYFEGDHSFGLVRDNLLDDKQAIFLKTFITHGKGKYKIYRSKSAGEWTFVNQKFASIYPCSIYDLDTTKTNYIDVIHFDTLNKIASAKFEMTVCNPCNDTIRITEGRFDVKYRKN